jgi:acetyl-CoA synthetase
MCANYPSMPVRPGSMGRPFPGVHVTVIDDEGNEIAEPMVEGALVVEVPWPSMFRTYWNDQERYDSRFKGAGTSPATARSRTPTATSGSSAATTT